MTNNIVRSAQAMGNLCCIMNRNRPQSIENLFGWKIAKVVDLGICPHCGMKMVKHIVEDGARYHVHSYIGHRDKSRSPIECSDPHCEVNHGVGRCVDSNGKPYR